MDKFQQLVNGGQQALTEAYNRLPSGRQVINNLSVAAPTVVGLTAWNNIFPGVAAESVFGNSTMLVETVVIIAVPSLIGALLVGVVGGCLLGRYCCPVPSQSKYDVDPNERGGLLSSGEHVGFKVGNDRERASFPNSTAATSLHNGNTR